MTTKDPSSPPPGPDDAARPMLRHTLATLAYRGGKAVRGAPDGFAEHRERFGERMGQGGDGTSLHEIEFAAEKGELDVLWMTVMLLHFEGQAAQLCQLLTV